MNDYFFKIDEKIIAWRSNFMTITADTEEEAKEILKEKIDHYGPCQKGEDLTEMQFDNKINFGYCQEEVETETNMSVEENQGAHTIEVSFNDEFFWDNVNFYKEL